MLFAPGFQPTAHRWVATALAMLALVGCAAPERVLERPTGAAPRAAAADLERARQRFAEHGLMGSFVLLTPSSPADPSSPPRALVVEHGDEAKVRRVPASTFKLLNTLIGLETGAVTPETVFPWDGAPRLVKAWEKELSLREAFRVSCVPCYQELARRVGLARMRSWLEPLGYGNGETGEAVDTFWLVGPLAISVEEEAAFVRRLFLGELPFGGEALDFVRGAMLLDDSGGYRLFGKTGWADGLEPNVGWLVGWVEVSGAPSFFATRVLVAEDEPGKMALRRRLTLELLADLGVLPEAAPAGGVSADGGVETRR
jgi:beta-lactamase class D